MELDVSHLGGLPESIAHEQRKPFEHLRNATAGERIEVLAAAHSGLQGLLALTESRVLFAWNAGALQGVKSLVRERSAIIAAQTEGEDLLLRDAEQLLRFKKVTPAECAGEIAAKLHAHGAHESVAAQPQDGPARGALRIIPAKTRNIVEQILRPDENVHVVFVGAGGQAMVAADDRIVVVKAGFMAGATFGQKSLDFAYDQISGIELHVGAMTGYLQITSPAFQGNLPGSYWSKEKQHDPWKLPNCIPIGRAAGTKFQASLALVRERIAKGHWTDGIGAPPVIATPEPALDGTRGTDLASQLKELAALRDAGVLTDEEFQQAKQKLLG